MKKSLQHFVDGLGLIERAADDDRNFVTKAVSMALKAIGKRNAALKTAASRDLRPRSSASRS